ncbi:MAG: DNA/RNA non-specific endonuclease [Pseudomonadales bacterium]|nr:DNA/RNA non-specific endonuclease [Pseudomonadales bacterium]
MYTLSADSYSKLATWVAYEVNPNNFGSSRNMDWKNNPSIDNGYVLEPEDYEGAYEAFNVDIARFAPLATFSGSTFWYEANYMSNISPFNSKLYRGAWKQLEQAVRDASSIEHPLYVLTGPAEFHVKSRKLPNAESPIYFLNRIIKLFMI